MSPNRNKYDGIFKVLCFVIFISACNSSSEEYEKNVKRAKGAISTADFERAIQILEDYKLEHESTKEIDSLISYASRTIPYRDSAQKALNSELNSVDSINNARLYIQKVNEITKSSLCNGKKVWHSTGELVEDIEKLNLIERISEDDKFFGEIDKVETFKCQGSIPIIKKRMRQSFQSLFNTEAWEENMEARLQGEKSDHLIIMGPELYDNQGKKEGYELLEEKLRILGFEKVTFKGAFSDTGHTFEIN